MNYKKAYEEALEKAKQGLPIDEIFPELKESEDERIRKKLIEIIGYFRSRGMDQQLCEECLAYLEKQKEQKPVQDKEEREYVRTLKSLIADFLRDKEEVDRGYYQDIYDWLDGRHIEQKPTEWSEEDDEMLVGIIERGSAQIPPHEPALREEQMEWLMNRLKSLRPQPKQEDRYIEGYQNGFADAEKAYNNGVPYHIDNPNIHKLDPNVVIHSTTDGTDVYCPHWKPSEEQMKALEFFIRSWGESGTMSPQNTILCAANSLYNDIKKLL